MSNYRRANTKGGTYFFTVVTYRRQKFLCNENVRKALRNGILYVQKNHPFVIDAWVLLPDHLHCIWTLPPDDANLGKRWAMIKRFVTKQCGPDLRRNDWMNETKWQRKESTIRQRRFWEHQIRNERDYEIHMDCPHYNHVKPGYVKNVKDWLHSTFHRYVCQVVYDENWGGTEVMTTEEGFGE
jgi:putative transposase